MGTLEHCCLECKMVWLLWNILCSSSKTLLNIIYISLATGINFFYYKWFKFTDDKTEGKSEVRGRRKQRRKGILIHSIFKF